MDDYAFREQEISPELVRIAAEEEIRSTQPEDESAEKPNLADQRTPSGPRTRTAAGRPRRSYAGAGKNAGPKKRKVLMRCIHEGECFEKSFVEESINMSQVLGESENISGPTISIVMNPPIDSIIWSFCGFPEIDAKICTSWVICTICKSVFSFSDGTTSGAKRHVESKHRQALAAVRQMGEVEPGQILVADYGANSIPMRLITEAEINESNLTPRRRKRELDSIFDAPEGLAEALATSETTLADGQSVRVVFDDYKPDERKPRIRRIKKAENNISTPLTPFSNTHCNVCNVDFRNLALAMMHRSCHGSTGRFSCAQCGEVLGNVFDFWGHLYSRSCSH